MGIGQKVKDVAHKMGVGHTGEREGASDFGSSYTNVGASYGAEGTGGIASPVAPGTAAVGSEERLAGEQYGTTETRTATAEVPLAVQQTTTTATTPGVEQRTEGATCGAQHFTRVEDRPIVKERVEMVQEHRPVEKEYVVETRATGAERAVGTSEVEHLGTTERVVAAEGPKAPCA